MDSEVGVPLPRAHLAVRERRVTDHLAFDQFVFAERQRTQRLGEDFDGLRTNRDLSRSREEHGSFDANEVTDIAAIQE